MRFERGLHFGPDLESLGPDTRPKPGKSAGEVALPGLEAVRLQLVVASMLEEQHAERRLGHTLERPGLGHEDAEQREPDAGAGRLGVDVPRRILRRRGGHVDVECHGAGLPARRRRDFARLDRQRRDQAGQHSASQEERREAEAQRPEHAAKGRGLGGVPGGRDLVADAPHGGEPARLVGSGLDLLAQPIDMGFKRVGGDTGIVAPDIVQQDIASDDLFAGAVKELDYCRFLFRKAFAPAKSGTCRENRRAGTRWC